MKKIILSTFVFLALVSCKNETATTSVDTKNEIAQFSPEIEENAVIYEVNIRQYSPEGTFNEFTKDIPKLKELGVKIIWVMPVFPISETKRKATGGDDSKFASEMPKEEQHKYLGSYYAVSDFKKVNPEFGTIEDFRAMVKTAHENGMYVILDWVPNHTGWDHVWIKEHPEFYTKNEKGEIIDPINPETGKSWGWTDVADLNYDNKELRAAMTNDMLHWIKNENIDGFRCDVAGNVPTDFWQQAIPTLRKEKNIFMLAEAWEPELFKNNLFDMGYSWEGHHTMNKIAKGKETVANWDVFMEKRTKEYEANDILMNFVDNHDENSWNGTIQSRLGNAEEAMTVLSYLTPGMPLVYNGNEYGLNHSLKFFEKDSIPKTKGAAWQLRAKLGKLKNENIALNGGKNKASYTRIKTTNENVLVFEREKNGNKIIYMANLSSKPVDVKIPLNGTYIDVLSGEMIGLNEKLNYPIKPWQYYVLTE
ncbi:MULTISPECIES: alpha-amylase family glycosyl hydrolase [unclassified Flavobacterium]|uniref:alpha-amylase family glycosyl hydrolase n=1 Tax=unclassified Flavobacterium TaxID=196869 RepID=UPI001291BA0E|nr:MULTISPECIES: alpha-amylase family glycosyl hydrolase [unclassified Flavobacterium]MQP52670.1 alpha-amylase [Flavobacterium sp. LMO9]MQP62150.1 alpha-amylase [Flavobacterium sp. LMO6]